ncbi:DUF3263 domain-containing protein [Demequina sp. B12]|uniref:DUF3263 domain-containing protein n=1 Tax=Demequina sp. B12 TaxID=2992757 RepID=UPI00237AB06A|nr:DUF3263 domain-containing protein [Demequina sp. B12]MDE0573714.1 DUF3263 domain-containing protein [Demequina sp. B12]
MTGADGTQSMLSAQDKAVLAMEGRWWSSASAKEDAIRDELSMSATHYYQVLGALLESPAALEHAPMVVTRLQRLRDSRRRGSARAWTSTSAG